MDTFEFGKVFFCVWIQQAKRFNGTAIFQVEVKMAKIWELNGLIKDFPLAEIEQVDGIVDRELKGSQGFMLQVHP